MKQKQKALRRSLWASVLAVMLCAAMLLGTTFAWFTDTVSSTGNTIQSGTLDIALTGGAGDTQTLFTADGILWEPGRARKADATLTNAGTLWLKYALQVTNLTGVAEGDTALAEVLDVYISDTAIEDAADLTDDKLVGTVADLADVTANEVTGILAPNTATDAAYDDSDPLHMVIKMRESAGNQYQDKQISFDVVVTAAQYTHEQDGFENPNYDQTAEFAALSTADMVNQIETARPGAIVTVAANETAYDLPASIPESVTIAGSGASNTTLKVPTTETTSGQTTNCTGLVIDQPGVTIKDVAIIGAGLTSEEHNGYIDIREGGTTLDGVLMDYRTCDASNNASMVVVKRGVDEGETVRIANSTLIGRFKTIDIVDGANGTVEIDSCEITGIYTFNVNSANSQKLVMNITNSKLHGWTSYGDIKQANFTNTEFSIGEANFDFMRPYADTTLTNCTFDAGFTIGAGATGKTYTITNCTKDGTKVTAENVQELLLTTGKDDMPNLRGCTIIVDGVTATLT